MAKGAKGGKIKEEEQQSAKADKDAVKRWPSGNHMQVHKYSFCRVLTVAAKITPWRNCRCCRKNPPRPLCTMKSSMLVDWVQLLGCISAVDWTRGTLSWLLETNPSLHKYHNIKFFHKPPESYLETRWLLLPLLLKGSLRTHFSDG